MPANAVNPQPPSDLIVTFDSGHLALAAEQALQQTQLFPRLITAPRAISSECGFCLLIRGCQPQSLVSTLSQSTIAYRRIFTRSTIKGVTHYAQYH